MSCQTTPYDSRRLVFSRSELQVVQKADVEATVSLTKFFQLAGDYASFDITVKSGVTLYELPLTDSLLIDSKLRSIWLFPTYEKTEYEATECIEWSFTETLESDMRWYPVSKILALSGTTNGIDTSKLIKPIVLRNLTDHDVKIKVIITN